VNSNCSRLLKACSRSRKCIGLMKTRWFPEPALIYAYASGVTKPRMTATGKVSGLGTVFGPDLRKVLAPQFLKHLAAIHTFDYRAHALTSIDKPRAGTTESALWQLNRARRALGGSRR